MLIRQDESRITEQSQIYCQKCGKLIKNGLVITRITREYTHKDCENSC